MTEPNQQLVEAVARDAEIDDRHLSEQFDHAERHTNWLYARKLFSYTSALLERAIDDEVAEAAEVERLKSDLAAIQATDAECQRLRSALAQAAVPLEALLICRAQGSVDLSDHSWNEIENGVLHIRAALKEQSK